MNEQSTGSRGVVEGAVIDAPFALSIAFQPIVDVRARRVYAYEALVRGLGGEPACEVLSKVTDENRSLIDQTCRANALTLAANLKLAQTGASLSINFMPGTVYGPGECMQLTLDSAQRCGFPLEQLIFEITEDEEVRNRVQLAYTVEEYRRRGLRIALDDFGAGHSGLTLLASIPTDIVKLDKELISNLHNRPAAMTIVRAMLELCRTLGSDLIAEGVETEQEYKALCRCGVHLMQGYLFARPTFEELGRVNWPARLSF